MNPDQESLLPLEPQSVTTPQRLAFANRFYLTPARWRKNVFLLLLSIFIATCLTVYVFLNLIAINGNQTDPNSYKPLSRRKPMLDHESIFSDSGPSMIRLSDLLSHCIVALQIAGTKVVQLSLRSNDHLSQVGSKGKTREGVDDIVTGADMISHKMIINTIKDSYRRLNVVSEEDTTKDFETVRPEEDLLPISRVEFAKMTRSHLDEIEKFYPGSSDLVAQDKTLVWIDPLDATKEYSENLTQYVTLMACIVHESKPVAGIIYKPFTNDLYWSIGRGDSTKSYYHSTNLTEALEMRQRTTGKQARTRVVVSRSHAGDVKGKIEDIYGDNAEVIPAGGSGYKSIELIKGSVDAYVHVTHIKKWDICAPYAILRSIQHGKMTTLSGDKIDFGNPKEKLVTDGIIATMAPDIHRRLVDSFQQGDQRL